MTRHRDELEEASQWQWRFAEQILARTPGLDPAWVTTEFPFTDSTGRARRIDFVIRRPDGVRVAIEVDGFDKTGRGGGMTQLEFQDFLRRQNSVVAQGWRLLRFANSTLRDDPAGCRAELAAALPPMPASPPVVRRSHPVPQRATPPAVALPVDSAWSEGKTRLVQWGAALLVIAMVLGGCGYLMATDGGAAGPKPQGGECPASAPYKANESSGIFHAPGQRYYDSTRAERCFSSPGSAKDAGFRAAKV